RVRTPRPSWPVAHAPLHLLQMTFFCRDSFRVVPLYRSSRVTGSGCTTVFPDHRTERDQTPTEDMAPLPMPHRDSSLPSSKATSTVPQKSFTS
uniref:Uncharacterized protein n=1 Tax=Gopherus evgoodei TaxID=1825980 RepID=A0A8C4WNK4_9SAUR